MLDSFRSQSKTYTICYLYLDLLYFFKLNKIYTNFLNPLELKKTNKFERNHINKMWKQK